MDHSIIKRKVAFAKEQHAKGIPIDWSKYYAKHPIEEKEPVHPYPIDENHPIIKLAAQIKARQNKSLIASTASESIL